MTRHIPLSDEQLEDIANGAVYRLRGGPGEPILIGRSDVIAELDESVGIVGDGRRSVITRRGDQD